jgi:hypothetical protein
MNRNTKFWVRLASLLALTLIVQMAGFPQPVTGPLVNALLFIVTELLGLWAGIFIGLLTPVLALFRGQLPALLAPMVPFIAVANTALVILFGLTRKLKHRNPVFRFPWPGIILSAGVKYLVLLAAVKSMVPAMTGSHFPSEVEYMMAMPQFLTAITGGVVYVVLMKFINKLKV